MKERKEISKEKKEFLVKKLDKRMRDMIYIKGVGLSLKKFFKKLVFWEKI